MKSKTSFFNGTVFKKNLTRFAPVWGGYILCLLLGMFLMMDSNLEYWFAANFAELVNLSGVINLGYALLVAQVLFGDLYNTRMCNALHAMPMRRECWFWTNVASGMFFSILPTVIFTAVSIPIIAVFSSMVNGWQLPLYWLLANQLEYLFFFGVAVFSVFCTGSRVGMAVVYGILNFFSYMVYFLMDTVYVPALHGVILQDAIFQQMCPLGRIIDAQFIDCTRHEEFLRYNAQGHEVYNIYGTFELTPEWSYLWIIAVVGIALALVALLMYRRRRLECAGDLISTRKLEPAFMVLFSLSAAMIFHYTISIVMAYRVDHGYSVFLFIGLAVGWFAGRMLLERQVAVFRRGKNWLGLLLLAAVFGLSMFLNTLDPLGIVTWTPRVEEVKQVTFGIGWRGQIDSEDPEVIADAIRLHELALEEMLTPEMISQERMREDLAKQAAEQAEAVEIIDGKSTVAQLTEEDYRKSCSIHITYELKNGRTVEREYYLWVDSEAGELLNRYTSSVEAVFYDQADIETLEDLLDTVGEPEYFMIENVPVPEELMTEETVESFFRAVIADCQAGTMTQYMDFHEGKVIDEEEMQLQYYSVDLNMGEGKGYYYLNIYADSENCLTWLESLGILDEVREEVSRYYG